MSVNVTAYAKPCCIRELIEEWVEAWQFDPSDLNLNIVVDLSLGRHAEKCTQKTDGAMVGVKDTEINLLNNP